jgi:hypothetical protein
MSALGMASLGTQCEDKALGMSSLGVFCKVIVIILDTGEKRQLFAASIPDLLAQVGDDEEILEIIIIAAQADII